MLIRKLNLTQIKDLHTQCMKRDFPKNELRPYSMIKKLYKNNKYVVYGAFNDEVLLGYSCIMMSDSENCLLLDYFAVQPQLRGSGMGSEFFNLLIAMLKKEHSNKAIIIIECENPEVSVNLSEKNIRERRIRFYTRNGAKVTNSYWHAFGVDYSLLTVTINDSVKFNSNIGEVTYNLYMQCFTPLIKNKMKKYLKWK